MPASERSRERPALPIALNLARILHRLLLDLRGWRVDKLKEELGIQDRTYRKYRALLQQYFDHSLGGDGRAVIVETHEGEARYLRIRVCNDEEVARNFYTSVAALYLVRQAFSFLGDTDLGQALDAFCREIIDRTKERWDCLGHILLDMDRMLFHVADAPKDYSGRGDALTTIVRCLFFSRRLRMVYRREVPREEPEVVEPLTLLAWRGGLYLVARYPDHPKTYTFAVDRMEQVEVTKERFSYPPPNEYSPDRLHEGCFGIFREDGGEPTTVELVFANVRWLKLNLTERRWHPTQRFEELPDGRLRLTFTVTSMVEVWPWIRSFGDLVEVIQPSPPP